MGPHSVPCCALAGLAALGVAWLWLEAEPAGAPPPAPAAPGAAAAPAATVLAAAPGATRQELPAPPPLGQVTGRLLSDDGSALSGWRIRLRREPTEPPLAETRTDPAGRFTLDAGAGVALELDAPDARLLLATDLWLRAGRCKDLGDLVASERLLLSVWVTGGEQRPVGQALVWLEQADPTLPGSGGLQVRRLARTGEAGHAWLRGSASGSFLVHAAGPAGHAVQPIVLDGSAPPPEVRLQLGSPPRGHRVFGAQPGGAERGARDPLPVSR